MDDVFRFADDLGPLKLVHIHPLSIRLKAVVAPDNIACGSAIGGVRMAPDVSTEEAFRLARAMTFKNATASLPHGGGKSVIFADPKMPLSEKERLIRGFATAIGDLSIHPEARYGDRRVGDGMDQRRDPLWAAFDNSERI